MSDTTYQLYLEGSEKVQSGWCRGAYRRGTRVCLVQGVLDAARIPGQALPGGLIDELDQELMQYPAYRQLRRSGAGKQQAIMAWNDAFWRRKRTVVATLDAVGITVLMRELDQAHATVANLRNELSAMRQRVEDLERENRHLIRRLFNYTTLRTAREAAHEAAQKFDFAEAELQKMITDSQERQVTT